MVSVRLGARETMRCTGCGTRTVRPASSTKSLYAGAAAGLAVGDCACSAGHKNVALNKSAAIALGAAVFLRASFRVGTKPRWQKQICKKQKSPTRHPGAFGAASSREKR